MVEKNIWSTMGCPNKNKQKRPLGYKLEYHLVSMFALLLDSCHQDLEIDKHNLSVTGKQIVNIQSPIFFTLS